MPSVTQSALALEYFAATRETVRDYEAKGAFTRGPDGKYDPVDCLRKTVKWQADRLAGRTGGGGDASLSSERALLTREQTTAAQIKNAAARGDLVSVVEVQRSLADMLSVFRERLLTLPGKLADALSMRTREEIEPVLRAEIYEALDELHDPTNHASLGSENDSEDVSDGAESPKAATEPKPD